MPEEKSKDVIEIPVGKYFSKARENPWIIASIVLGLLFVFTLAFSLNGAGLSVASEEEVGEKVVEFLNSQVQTGEVTLNSIDWNEGGYYEVLVEYQGDEIPLYATSDGNNIITDLLPLIDSDVSNTNTNTNTGNSRVNIEVPANVNVKGDLNAPVTIIEFSDFECPYCARFFEQTLPLIEENYVDTGKVKLIYMHFPLGFHQNAQMAGEASECAAEQGKFWEMHDKIFENFDSLNNDIYLTFAGELNLDVNKFNTCLDSGKYEQKVKDELALGQEWGVSGTPGFFIGNEEEGFVLVEGALPYSNFEAIIEQELQ